MRLSVLLGVMVVVAVILGGCQKNKFPTGGASDKEASTASDSPAYNYNADVNGGAKAPEAASK